MPYFPQHNQAALRLGAVAYYDEFVYPRRSYSYYESTQTWHFARYYFNAQGKELAYFIPDLARFHPDILLHIHPVPRTWGIPHNLESLIDGYELT